MKNIQKFANSTAGQVTIITAVGIGILYLVERKAYLAAQSVNPVNRDNIFNQGFNAVGAALTSEQDFSFGRWLYEKLNPRPKLSDDYIGG